MSAYYNEHDQFAAGWLRESIAAGLIADGIVDERSIADVRAGDLDGFTQAHFFAGIGGWSHALRLAGWPDDRPVWTGSCPCQPHSTANVRTRTGVADARHLWPVWGALIAQCRPPVVFGEQVPSPEWVDEVRMGMDGMGYAFGGIVLPAHAFGFDHARERFYFAGHTDSYREPVRPEHEEAPRVPRDGSDARGVVPTNGLPRRRALLRAFGNAIVPQVAAAVIASFMEVRA